MLGRKVRAMCHQPQPATLKFDFFYLPDNVLRDHRKEQREIEKGACFLHKPLFRFY
jgi:hypothetical protein